MVILVASHTVLETDASTSRRHWSANPHPLVSCIQWPWNERKVLTMYNSKVSDVHLTRLEWSFAVVLIGPCSWQRANNPSRHLDELAHLACLLGIRDASRSLPLSSSAEWITVSKQEAHTMFDSRSLVRDPRFVG